MGLLSEDDLCVSMEFCSYSLQMEIYALHQPIFYRQLWAAAIYLSAK